jgi:protein SCO1/2
VLRGIRIAAWGAILAGIVVFALFKLRMVPSDRLPRVEIAVGAPFELATHDGRRLSSKELEGRPFALFFGFTNCPDVCPTTLLEMSNHMKALGPAADRLRVLFVTIDPERDTPAHLKAYLANFDDRIVGLIGTPEEIRKVAKSYYATYEKIPTSTGYTMNHTASVFLMGPDGRFRGTINYQEPEADQRAKLKRLLGVVN